MLLSASLGFEHGLWPWALYAVGGLTLLLVFSFCWISRLNNRAAALEGARSRRELLSMNDFLTLEIEKRDALELELRSSAARYRIYVEHAPMGIFVANGDGEFAFVNPAIGLMTGFSKNELATLRLAELFSPDISTESNIFFESLSVYFC